MVGIITGRGNQKSSEINLSHFESPVVHPGFLR
jgi:hypothetical protein